jgi:hypothetical protein
MWLPWEWGAGLAALSFVVRLVVLGRPRARGFSDSRRGVVASFCGELTLVLVLYCVWQIVGSWSLIAVDDAIARGNRLLELEAHLPLPTELDLQHWMLPYPAVVQGANLYYAAAHVPALVGCLIWAFCVDRDRYRTLRTSVALTTGACLLVQFVPVAPPRLLDGAGFVDTAVLYNQSVYSALGRGMAGQLAAMPSVHVAWAIAVGWFGLVAPVRRSLRTLCVLHALVTNVVVVVTANHFWIDGLVAIVFFFVSVWLAERFHRTASQERSG